MRVWLFLLPPGVPVRLRTIFCLRALNQTDAMAGKRPIVLSRWPIATVNKEFIIIEQKLGELIQQEGFVTRGCC